MRPGHRIESHSELSVREERGHKRAAVRWRHFGNEFEKAETTILQTVVKWYVEWAFLTFLFSWGFLDFQERLAKCYDIGGK
jgi:hypothetical protein